MPARKPAARPAPRDRFTETYLSALLWRAAFAFAKQFHAEVRKGGLSVPVWRTLAALSDGEGMTVGELAKVAVVQQPTMTKAIDRMVRDGLVDRRASPDDRRKTLIYSTAEGRRVVRHLVPAALRHEQETLGDHSADEVARLKQLLRELIDRCERPRGRRAP